MCSGDAPIVRAVLDFPDGRSHTTASGRIDNNSLLLHKRQIRAVDHPAVGKMIQQCFHLPRNMEHIGRCAEDNQFGLLHSIKNWRKSCCATAFLLLSFDAGIAPYADMGHIPWELKLEKLTACQEFLDKQFSNIVST